MGVERTGWGGGAQGFISGGMLPVSKDTHFTQKNKWVPHTHHFLTTSWVIFRDFFPISQALLSSFTSHSFYFPPPLFRLHLISQPSSILHHALCSPLHLVYPLHLSGCVAPQTLQITLTLSLHSPIPSSAHVTPISVSPVCLVTARQSFFFSRTRQYKKRIELLRRMGVISQSGTVSACEVTYSDKAPGGGVSATAP